MHLRKDCDYIVSEAIKGVLPDAAVKKALQEKTFSSGRIITVAIGKAAFSMASAAKDMLGERMGSGIVISKYGHANGAIEGLSVFEAGHPIPDEATILATEVALKMTENLQPEDTVLFLVSGGGSALFESPFVELELLQDVTKQLLACGANITEINMIRKRLSKVKGGRFALHCAPAKVYSIVLSDVLGDPLDMIASGPAYPDSSSCKNACAIIEKYSLKIPAQAMYCLKHNETPKHLNNVETVVTGSVKELCACAAKAAVSLGYEPVVLTDSLDIQAREAGGFLAAISRYAASSGRSIAFIAGGETVVRLIGTGKGGRNQELALCAALGIEGLSNVAVFSVGSDGTDGPTDAAGGYADGKTVAKLMEKGISAFEALQNNDAYNALAACGGLIITGPTGTNVNDVAVALVKAFHRQESKL